MATLLGQNINETYDGLLKTTTNGTIGTNQLITDGLGCATSLTLGSIGTGSSFDNSLVIGTTLLVCNQITTNNNLLVKGSHSVDGNACIAGSTTSGSLTAGNFKFTGSGTFNGALTLCNTLNVNGTSSLVNTAINGDLNVSNNICGSQNLTVNGTINAGGDIVAFTTSDNRLKDNLSPINSENFVSNLTGYEFDWNDRSKKSGKGKGIIAQDLYKLDDSLVRENNDGYLSVDYISLIPILIEEVKRLGKEINELKK